MSVRVLAAGIFACLAIAAQTARAADPIANYENQPVGVSGGGGPSSAQVRDAIIAAGRSRQWRMTDAGPGKLIGSLSVRNRHQIEVNIDYDPQRYSITYRNSVNMGYNAANRTIHANYNAWVGSLRSSIAASLALVKPDSTPVAAVQPAAAPVPAVVATGGLPNAGDSWSYRLSDPQRRQGERGVFVKIASASGGAIVDHVSVEGGFTTPLTHAPGAYLVMQGPSVFSPYIAVFQKLEAGAALAGIRVVDPGCKDVYVCEAKGRVAGVETVELPAGRFNATKVVIEQSWRPVFASRGNQPLRSSRTLTVWYAQEVKRAVKYSSRLTGANPAPIDADFDLVLANYTVADAPPAAPAPAAAAGAAADRTEISFWESVRDSRNPAELEAYLDRYPRGAFAPLARARLSALASGK